MSAIPQLHPQVYSWALQILSDMHAHVLVLDAERQRLTLYLEFLDGVPSGARALDRAGPAERHRRLGGELEILWTMIDKMRSLVDPAGRYL
ncbi:MAG: hypothetical protein ACJ780_19645 [Solirubrobacteraceae bacterium]